MLKLEKIRRRLWIAAFLLISVPGLADATRVCNVRDFGAKGDDVTLDAAAISPAVAACVKQGGGTVYVPPGRYVMGTVQLFSHIRLFLESGALLVGSHDIHDYGCRGLARFCIWTK
jgi:polygalacturonase